MPKLGDIHFLFAVRRGEMFHEVEGVGISV